MKSIRLSLPTSCGVYYFYSDNALLYIGKAINLKARINSHFYDLEQTALHARMMSQIKHIKYQLCAGELGALLLEAAEIKKLQPLYNKRLRKYRDLYTFKITHSPYLSIALEALKNVAVTTPRAGLFRSQSHAGKWLEELAREHNLCKKVLGLEKGKGPCFGYQLAKCQGVCCGKEPRENHDDRLHQALEKHILKIWPWASAIAIRETDLDNNLCQYHIFSDWRHICSVNDLKEISGNNFSVPQFDRDGYKILAAFLAHHKPDVIELCLNKT